MLKQVDNATNMGAHRSPELAELLDSLGGKDSLSTLGELLDALPLGVAVIGADEPSLPVLYLNSRASWIAGADPEELIGRPLGEAFPGPEEVAQVVRQAHEQSGRRQVCHLTAAGQGWRFEAVGLRRGARGDAGVLATWHEAPDQAPGPPGTSVDGAGPGSSLDPVGLRDARLYDRAQKAARRLQMGVDVAMEVATHFESEEVVGRVVQRALEAVDAERATLARPQSDLQCTILGSVDRSRQPSRAGLTVSLEGQEPAVQAIRSHRPAQGRIAYEEIGLRPLRWSLVIPLLAGDELIALLSVARDGGQFDEEEVAVLQQIGAIAALGLRNATLFQALRDTSRVRSQFLNMAAHELRTPLSVIAGYISMLADGTLGPAPSTWEMPLSVLVDKTRELAHLIDDILLAGRLDSGVARTAGRSMDLTQSLDDAVRRAGPRAALLSAELKVRAPDSAVRVWADPDHVGRILDNLVNNAFNYSPTPPRVSIGMEANRGSAVLTVEDRGWGISADHRERIFQQFYRVDDQEAGYPPGTGLGLFISRALAERYGGTLELEWSEPGVGSRFALRLPLAPAA
jgi:signal transduction histidine kinase